MPLEKKIEFLNWHLGAGNGVGGEPKKNFQSGDNVNRKKSVDSVVNTRILTRLMNNIHW